VVPASGLDCVLDGAAGFVDVIDGRANMNAETAFV
jgi:hypothetical protein